MRVGDIIIYGANEVSETILDDIPSPKEAEEIILTRMNAIGFGNQNTYINAGYQQTHYNQQNQYMQQNPYNQSNSSYYQQDQGYIQPEHDYEDVNYTQQGNYSDPDCIQPEHNQNNNQYYTNNENDMGPQEYYNNNWENKTIKSTKKLDKDQILKKHDEMFKRHK
jgi:hypothetical protein